MGAAPDRVDERSITAVAELSVEELRSLLFSLPGEPAAGIFAALHARLGVGEASRRWLAVFSATDASET